MGGARVDVEVEEDLLREAKSRGDLDEINNCSFETGSFEPGSSKMGRPVVEVARIESPCLNFDTKFPYILYSSAVRGRASLLNRVT